MNTLLSVLAGACTSMAYIAPKPYWFVALLGQVAFLIWMRTR